MKKIFVLEVAAILMAALIATPANAQNACSVPTVLSSATAGNTYSAPSLKGRTLTFIETNTSGAPRGSREMVYDLGADRLFGNFDPGTGFQPPFTQGDGTQLCHSLTNGQVIVTERLIPFYNTSQYQIAVRHLGQDGRRSNDDTVVTLPFEYDGTGFGCGQRNFHLDSKFFTWSTEVYGTLDIKFCRVDQISGPDSCFSGNITQQSAGGMTGYSSAHPQAIDLAPGLTGVLWAYANNFYFGSGSQLYAVAQPQNQIYEQVLLDSLLVFRDNTPGTTQGHGYNIANVFSANALTPITTPGAGFSDEGFALAINPSPQNSLLAAWVRSGTGNTHSVVVRTATNATEVVVPALSSPWSAYQPKNPTVDGKTVAFELVNPTTGLKTAIAVSTCDL